MSREIEVEAPAKINLGLEVLEKRSDGFHEIRSVLHGIALADTLTFRTRSGGHPATGVGMPGLPVRENLIDRALTSASRLFSLESTWNWHVRKRIPEAAGLGGGSSDAAATLLAMKLTASESFKHASLHVAAASLGSDVPFFLGPLAARIAGRGELVQSLDLEDFGWDVILICPRITIANKTSRLYSLLEPGDLSDGGRISVLINALETNQPIDRSLLGNAFAAPLYRLEPSLADIPAMLDGMNICVHGLSGAGPTHYALVDHDRRFNVLDQLQRVLGASCDIIMTELRRSPILPCWTV